MRYDDWSRMAECPVCEVPAGVPCVDMHAYRSVAKTKHQIRKYAVNLRGKWRSPAAETLLSVLTEEWQDYDQIVIMVGDTIPPGKAWRTANTVDEHHIRHGRKPVDRPKRQAVWAGRRRIVFGLVKPLVLSGDVEVVLSDHPKHKHILKIRKKV